MLKRLGDMFKTDEVSTITIKDKGDDEVIASGTTPQDVFKFEGNWYFNESHVNMERLTVTERTYTCSYKGTCYWIDLESPNGTVRNVGWIYRDPKRGYDNIKDRIAFYNGRREGTVAEQE